MESLGPTTVEALAARLQLPSPHVQAAMLRLESQGQVLRGRFRPGAIQDSQSTMRKSGEAADAPEWCHRRLLARIHRLTIGALRKEIEPVTASEFMGFLLRWQHAAPGARLHGEAGLAEVIAQLAGFEAAASAWEPHLLRLRLAKYEPAWLDRLCLSGAVAWGRLSAPARAGGTDDAPRRVMPTSAAPVSLFPREAVEWLVGPGSQPSGLGHAAERVFQALRTRGASFFHDVLRETGQLPAEVEQGLWELVAAGLVTADGFDNLRALLDPQRRRAEGRERFRGPRHAGGRWSLLRPAGASHGGGADESAQRAGPIVEKMARQLLRRYGVVFRDLVAREPVGMAWRDLLVQYRRMELQGEIRGGRFVSGFVGEQFALPEALESLRGLRKTGFGLPQEVKISAVDPLNLAGVILPGPRVPAVATNFLVIKDGTVARTVLGKSGEIRPWAQREARRSR
jgi:ATP-dependent Lhr-like helicase